MKGIDIPKCLKRNRIIIYDQNVLSIRCGLLSSNIHIPCTVLSPLCVSNKAKAAEAYDLHGLYYESL